MRFLAAVVLVARAGFVMGAVGAEEESVSVFFGCGCFWHVQERFIRLEQQLLKRSTEELSALVGYAGGEGTDENGKVCYHNWWQIADYDRLGHAEAVRVEVPVSQMKAFATLFFSLFVRGDRVDVQDVGPEYRSVIGLPGGMNSPFMDTIREANHLGLSLSPGEGSDPDTLGQRNIWVYDSDQFPFHQGEVYHQFHDDMMEKYDAAYHDLKRVLLATGKIQGTACPER